MVVFYTMRETGFYLPQHFISAELLVFRHMKGTKQHEWLDIRIILKTTLHDYTDSWCVYQARENLGIIYVLHSLKRRRLTIASY